MFWQKHLSTWIEKQWQGFGCMRTCNTFTVGVYWASNLHFFTHRLSLLFLFISFFFHSFPLSNCLNHCILWLFTWFANYANDYCWFRILVQIVVFPQLTQGFRSWSRFLQPTPNSAAVLLNDMFQVSSGKKSHMGKFMEPRTWCVSFQLTQTGHKNLWSTRRQIRSTEVIGSGTALRVLFWSTWRTGGIFLSHEGSGKRESNSGLNAHNDRCLNPRTQQDYLFLLSCLNSLVFVKLVSFPFL